MGFDEAVGGTSLRLLRGPSALTGCEIWGKLEWENPGGSIKDRPALWIIRDAERRGLLRPGQPGIVVEGTAGNTGIGLALAANNRGYSTLICLGDNQSAEKKAQLRRCGAKLLELPAVPFSHPNHFARVASRLATRLRELLDGRGGGDRVDVLYADQWWNPANRLSHYEGTGPEIWSQVASLDSLETPDVDSPQPPPLPSRVQLDGFSCAVGTGGSLAGIGSYLREQSAKQGTELLVALTDPVGAKIASYFRDGVVPDESVVIPAPGAPPPPLAAAGSIAEGVGQVRLTESLVNFRPDRVWEIPDAEALPLAYDLLRQEGLNIGLSSAINVAGAVRLARELGPGHRLVTLLCDSGDRYASKLFNPQFLRSQGLPEPAWLQESGEPPSNGDSARRWRPEEDLFERALHDSLL